MFRQKRQINKKKIIDLTRRSTFIFFEGNSFENGYPREIVLLNLRIVHFHSNLSQLVLSIVFGVLSRELLITIRRHERISLTTTRFTREGRSPPFNTGDLLNGDRSSFSVFGSLSPKYQFLTTAFAGRLYRQHNPFTDPTAHDTFTGCMGKKPIGIRSCHHNDKSPKVNEGAYLLARARHRRNR